MLAIFSNDEDVVNLLLAKSCFLATDFNRALKHATTASMRRLVIYHAKQLHCLDALIGPDGSTLSAAFYKSLARYQPHSDDVKSLMDIDNWHQYVDLLQALHYARLASWKCSDDFEEWDAICTIIKGFIPKADNKTLQIDLHAQNKSISEAYGDLFGENISYQEVSHNSFDIAIKRVMAKIYSLLTHQKNAWTIYRP